MNATQQKRLLKLADALENEVPKESFNMGHWIHTDNGMTFPEIKANLLASKCNTSACIIGWCPIIFPKHFKYDRTWAVIELVGEEDATHEHHMQSFFGLTYKESQIIYPGWFSEYRYVRFFEEATITPKLAAKAIRDIVAQYDKKGNLVKPNRRFKEMYNATVST